MILCTWICGRVILSQHKSVTDSDNLVMLPRLPRDEEGPVFAEQWQATAFALVMRLSTQGLFTKKEWATLLGEEIKIDAERGEADDGSRYYNCWLAALERVVVEKGLSTPAALLAQREAWVDAYRRTPHGMPVELEASAKS